MSDKSPCVYILASKRNGTLYIGVTSDLAGRVSVHKQGLLPGFTKRYGIHQLVYFEIYDTMEAAIRREKQMKKLRRSEKLALIEIGNPAWRDLYSDVSGFVEVGEPR